MQLHLPNKQAQAIKFKVMKTLLKVAMMQYMILVPLFSYAQSQCTPPNAKADLDINNVRTTILVGGDMWWDLSNPKYEIPQGSGKHSIFTGALWIGGIDPGGQIKVAAQTYRQTGLDFWGGPLDTTSVNITQQKCLAYDRHWKVTRAQVQNFINNPSSASNDIKSWPGNGDPSSQEGEFLAPFVDVDGDGEYDYTKGDYPGYNLSGSYPTLPGVNKSMCNDFLFGDQTIWWVFNDKGNVHSETNSDPIGLEIRAQAFAFQTNDEINNMTFYKYQIINRSTITLTNTYFGQWVDPDLGKGDDDYVGCDVVRGLGYCYNGDAEDETASGYGFNPPAVGIDFFQGPTADLSDSLDNDRDGCVDCTFITDSLGVISAVSDLVLREQIIMSKFVYYNNGAGPDGNPSGFTDFYNYLRGYWRDNQQITFGNDGRDPNSTTTNYMFPGTTDPAFPGQDWSELTANNIPGDRRFLQSAGTFTLQPGAVNYITTGVVWARATQGGQLASVQMVQIADDKAQALFDNCFKLIDGPDAPDMAVRELNQTIILSLINTNTDNIENYHQKDPTISGVDDSLKFYNFQGYQIFQLRDENATIADFGNSDRIRLIAQCDIKDGVAQLVNFTYESTLNANIPVEMVNGADKGVAHTFEIKQDLFASGSTTLVNHKTYFYTVVSYAHNNYKTYNQSDPNTLDGQKKPYLAGRNNVKTYSAIPHNPAPENNGLYLTSAFGVGPYVTRIEGQGNGGMALDFAQGTINEILTPPAYKAAKATYLPRKAPVDIKVYDPLLVKNATYTINLYQADINTDYSIQNNTFQQSVSSDYPISKPNEQVIPEWGFSTRINSVIEPGDSLDITNGFIEGTIEFSNANSQWLSAVKDIDNPSLNSEDWIRSGTTTMDYRGIDKFEVYENVVNGTWAPYKLASKDPTGLKWGSVGEILITLSPNATTKTGIASIDVVFTSDQSKWTRAAVIETGSNFSSNIGNARQFELRKTASIGKDNQPDNSIGATGMSWFPGYAYNLETGERLNIAFGENSTLIEDNSQDMRFNPTSRKYDSNGNPVLGGMHFIYIFGHNGDGPNDVPMYDSCRYIHTKLSTGNSNDKRAVWKNAMWCNIPLVTSKYEELLLPQQIPSDVKVRLRVKKNFRTYATGEIITETMPITPGITYYIASTPVIHSGTTYNIPGEAFIAVASQFTGDGTVTTTEPLNNFVPLYEFGTQQLAPVLNNVDIATEALQQVNVVPNPYYAYSSYEVNQLDNRIKIVNLPSKCTVIILTQSGTLVRKFKRDVPSNNTDGIVYSEAILNQETSIDWDLKNEKGIPIASGVYLIHVDAGHLGQKTLKWFGMIRPIDLDTF